MPKVLINRVSVGTGNEVSGKATNQDLPNPTSKQRTDPRRQCVETSWQREARCGFAGHSSGESHLKHAMRLQVCADTERLYHLESWSAQHRSVGTKISCRTAYSDIEPGRPRSN